MRHAVLLVTSLLLISCSMVSYKCIDPLGCAEIPTGSPVVIGVILATNGHLSPLGTACLDSIEEVIKDRQTILGHPLLLDSYATDGTPESARRAATDLATDPTLLAVIGPSLSEESLVVTPILTQAGIVSLSPVLDPAMARRMVEQVITSIAQVAIQKADKTLIIPRQALREALYPSP
jgi:ABC-type branched-subunit amino acid transport system substrate-binding protein